MTDLAVRIAESEGSGRIEYKRSCLWPLEKDDAAIHSVLMRLANTNSDTGGLIELGREDNGTRLGLVDKDKQPVTERQLKRAEQKLVQVAARLDPPMLIRWEPYKKDAITTIIVIVPGRPRGGWYQGADGVTKTGSASHPIVAKQSLLQQWAREADERDERAIGTSETDTLLEGFIDETATALPSSNELAYLYVVVSPHQHDRSAFESVLSSAASAVSLLDSLRRQALSLSPRSYDPNLSQGHSWTGRNEGWVWRTHPAGPVQNAVRFIELLVNHDGTAYLACGRAGGRATTPVGFDLKPGDVRLIPDLVAGLTGSLLCICGGIYKEVGYHDTVNVGVRVTGSDGNVWGHALDPEAQPPNYYYFGPVIRTRDYHRVIQVPADRVVFDCRAVARDLVMTLLGPITPRAYDPFS